MNVFFLLLEIFLFAFGAYILLKKGELAIIYIPVLFFLNTVIYTHTVSAFAYYGLISVILLALMRKNSSFFKNNFFALCLTIYFLLLMTEPKDLSEIRQYLFYVIWFFISIPLISAIYQKYTREEVFKELALSSFIILSVFIANTALSSLFRFDVFSMYGITSGILYGNLMATDFNILGIALFIVLLSILKKKNILYLGVFVVALAFVVLSLRRSVMGVGFMGIGIVGLILASQNMKKVFLFGGIALLVGLLVVVNTDFLPMFQERYELRNLEDRALEEESRYIEYELLYEDMFMYKKYSPWFGFELFNSPGNYGGGIFFDRSLHGDLPSIAHSSGIVGVALYLLMVLMAVYQAYRASKTTADKLIVLFGVLTFMMYTGTGRYTEVGSMMLLFLTLKLPLAVEEEEEDVEDEDEEESSLEVKQLEDSYAR